MNRAIADGRDHPRIRGEHCDAVHIPRRHHGSSPHTRGARECGESDVSGAGIIPAYAGSTGHLLAGSAFPQDHPRIRGEHAHRWRTGFYGRGSSPHTRGAPVLLGIPAPPVGIIPAYAGSTGHLLAGSAFPQDHPRIRGEHESHRLPIQGIVCPSRELADHPRIRGEHPESGRGHHEIQGSSPHTRGAQVLTVPGDTFERIIPAYAGSTAIGPAMRPRFGDHPRIRGEHRLSRGMCPTSLRIIPAYAGSTFDSEFL